MARLVSSLYHPQMYKISWGDGTLSDMLNLSRAKDVLRELREKEMEQRKKAKPSKKNVL